MSMKIFARKNLRRGVRALSRKTIFSNVPRIRSLGFDALGAQRSLVVCEWPSKETFIVSAKDEIIGQKLFLSGEFDFDKFVAAYNVLSQVRPGRPPATLIDVGANIGTICIPAVARGYVQRAVAIEPEPGNCRLLRANAELNDLSARIQVREMAAGPVDGESLQLELSDYNLGDHRIRVPGTAADVTLGRRSVSVASNRLDTICAEVLDEDLFLWIDVQGFEGFVLAGSTALLNGRTPLVLEFWPSGMAQTGSFHLVEQGLAAYQSFVNLEEPSRVRPISDLGALRQEVGHGDAFTDILVF